MADIHLIRPLLRAAARGELPARVLTQLGLQHLLELCPHCREEFDAWQAEQRAESRAETDDGAESSSFARLEDQARRRAAERRRAGRDLKRLLELAPAARFEKVERARRHFRGAALVRLLLAESVRRRTQNAAEAYHLAELARAVARHSPLDPAILDLIALATAHMGNARRAGGNLRDAEEHFAFVRQLARQQGVVDPLVLAEIDHLEGSLRKDQRQFPLAEELLHRAAMLYRLEGDKTSVGRVLLTLGAVFYQKGQLDRALETTRSALRRLRRRSEPWLYLCGRYNLALYSVEAGRYEDAETLLAADEELYRQFADPWTQLRLGWVRGKIARARGELAQAEAAFLAARKGFLEQGVGYDAAMVSLDLALIYLEQGRATELRRLAEEVATIFAGQEVHREAAAALMLFHDAVGREALTTRMVHELVAYLRAAQADPSLRFKEPS